MFLGQSKIALQGAGFRPEGTLRITLFYTVSRILRVSLCMPLRAVFQCGSCQEAVYYSGKQCIIDSLFLWFAATLAGELDSRQCTHCSEKQCFRRVPRVTSK